VEAEIPPKLITLSCYDVYGCAYVNTAEKLVGKMRYTVMDDRGQEVLRSGLIDVNVSGAGKICFPMPLNASGWYWVKLGTEKWEIFERCKVREDPTLVLYLKFDEGSGTVAHDSSGYGNDGTLFDANTSNSDGNTPPQWVSGIYGYALEFDGVDDYVWLGSPESLKVKKFTILAWIKTTTSNEQKIYRWRSHGVQLKMAGGTNGKCGIAFYDSSTVFYAVTSQSYCNDNEWHLLTGTFDGTSLAIHIDETSENTLAVSAEVYYGSGGAAVGRDGDYNGAYFNGTIDEVRIYNRALSEAEIKAIYQAYAGG